MLRDRIVLTFDEDRRTEWNSQAEEESIYSRQAALGLYQPKDIAVIGVGGTGTWVALLVAMMGVETLHLFDDDVLELSNLGRLPYATADVGKLKVELARDMIERLRPNSLVCTYGKASGLVIKALQVDAVFDCTDKVKIQMELYETCKQAGIQYIRCGYDGNHITVTKIPSAWTTDESDLGDYSTAPSWVIPAVFAASFAICNLQDGNFEINSQIGDLGQREPLTEEGIKASPGYEDVFRKDMEGECDNCGRRDCEDCDRRDCEDCDATEERYTEGFEAGRTHERELAAEERNILQSAINSQDDEIYILREEVKSLKEKIAYLKEDLSDAKQS